MSEQCEYWANQGQCAINPDYMLQHCETQCGNVKLSAEEQIAKHEQSCKAWSDANECEKNPEYMFVHCPNQCCIDTGECNKLKTDMNVNCWDHCAQHDEFCSEELKKGNCQTAKDAQCMSTCSSDAWLQECEETESQSDICKDLRLKQPTDEATAKPT